MNQDFKILNNFMGFGNPYGKYWFVGIEESKTFEKSYSNLIKDYSKKIIPLLEGSIQKDAQKYGRNYTKVYDIMAKIVVELEGKDINWKEYRNKKLLQENSKEFQMNLFPLGKKETNLWPKFYQEKFGFKKQQDYLSYVVNNRFKLIRKFHQAKKPKITICFGKTYSIYFQDLFNLKNGYITTDGIELYERERVLITPFFDNRNMGWREILKTVELVLQIIQKSEL